MIVVAFVPLGIDGLKLCCRKGNKGSQKSFTLCNANSEEASTSATGGVEKVVYPPMSKEEIEEWMEHIPVFVITDQPKNDYSISYFFLNPLQANSLRWRVA